MREFLLDSDIAEIADRLSDRAGVLAGKTIL